MSGHVKPGKESGYLLKCEDRPFSPSGKGSDQPNDTINLFAMRSQTLKHSRIQGKFFPHTATSLWQCLWFSSDPQTEDHQNGYDHYNYDDDPSPPWKNNQRGATDAGADITQVCSSLGQTWSWTQITVTDNVLVHIVHSSVIGIVLLPLCHILTPPA